MLDSGARGSLTTFAERGIGDVLLSWENEALLATKGLDKDKYEIVYPSISILAEPSVAIVDKTVDKDGNRTLAKGYLNFLYSPLGQELAAKHYFRPRNPQVAAKYAAQFPKLNYLRSMMFLAVGQKLRKPILPMALSLIRFMMESSR